MCHTSFSPSHHLRKRPFLSHPYYAPTTPLACASEPSFSTVTAPAIPSPLTPQEPIHNPSFIIPDWPELLPTPDNTVSTATTLPSAQSSSSSLQTHTQLDIFSHPSSFSAPVNTSASLSNVSLSHSLPRPLTHSVSHSPSRVNIRQSSSTKTRGRRTSPNSKFQCPTCNQLYSRKDNLKAHMRVHTGEMPYGCSYCPRRFKWMGTTRSHEKRHQRDGDLPINRNTSNSRNDTLLSSTNTHQQQTFSAPISTAYSSQQREAFPSPQEEAALVTSLFNRFIS